MTDEISDSDIQKKMIVLAALVQEQTELSEYMRDLIDIYKIDPKIFTPEIWFSLINASQSGQPNDTMLGIFELRSQFRQKHSDKVGKLKSLNDEIYLNKIDVALEKINLLQGKLDSGQ